MRFINTLETVRLYLMVKPSLTQQEKLMLIQIREDLEYFPQGTLHRDDLVEYGYDVQLTDCSDMATLAGKIGEDCWTQMSKEQIPIIADAVGCCYSECPACSNVGVFEQDSRMWKCENTGCSLSWSYDKYACVGYSALTGFFLDNNIGFPASNEKETPMFIPISEHRKYFSSEPLKEQFFHIVNIRDFEIVQEIKEAGYIVIDDKSLIEKYGATTYWVSCYEQEKEMNMI